MMDRYVYDFEIGLSHGDPLTVTAEEGQWRMGTSPRGLTLQVEAPGVTDEFTLNPAHLMYIRTIRRAIEIPAEVSPDGTTKVSG